MSDIVDNPIYSTSVGLLAYGSKEAEVTEISKRMMSKTQTKRETSVLAPKKEIGPSFSATKAWQKLKHWFQSYI
jgi:cell division protein FtsA